MFYTTQILMCYTFHFSLLIDSAMQKIVGDFDLSPRQRQLIVIPIWWPDSFLSFGVAPPCMMSPVTAFKRIKCKIYILLIHLLQSMTFLFLVLLLLQVRSSLCIDENLWFFQFQSWGSFDSTRVFQDECQAVLSQWNRYAKQLIICQVSSSHSFSKYIH